MLSGRFRITTAKGWIMGVRSKGGRHRKSGVRRAPECDRGRRYPANHAAGRSASVVASAAIVAMASVTAASSVTATPEIKVQSPPTHDVTTAELTLAAASSPLNIPINFIIDAINIPQYEVDGLNYEAAAFFFTG
ncbi:MAG: hypothetical protein JWR78_1914, partial [Mycobacterium sp.]|nr:hypothetical protein [Mycobacterium sp.]